MTISLRKDSLSKNGLKNSMKRFRSDIRKDLFRLPISITKETEIWLQKLSNNMKSTGGYKLPKSYVIRGLLEAAMEVDNKLKIDVAGVKTEDEFTKRMLNATKRYK